MKGSVEDNVITAGACTIIICACKITRLARDV